MAVFTPPTENIKSDDPFFGRFGGTPTGLSVVRVNGVFTLTPYPWLGDLRPDLNDSSKDLVEGRDWFQGGRTYWVDSATAAALTAAGFTTTAVGGFGDSGYGDGGYGG